jgi:hypothetical protein
MQLIALSIHLRSTTSLSWQAHHSTHFSRLFNGGAQHESKSNRINHSNRKRETSRYAVG